MTGLSEWGNEIERKNQKRFFKTLERIIKHGGGKVLDVGALPGHMMRLLDNAQGVDIAPERMNLELDIKKCDIENEPLPFDDETFDTVLLLEVWEHLRVDPKAVLLEISRVL